MAEEEGRNLESTPSWAIAAVVLIFVSLSLLVVFVIDQIEERLKRAHKTALVHTVQKMKEELMLLGFISLLLTVFGTYVEKICVADRITNKWNWCRRSSEEETEAETPSETEDSIGGHGRRLFALNSWPMNAWTKEPIFRGRMLADEGSGNCKEGQSPLMSKEGLEMLHTLIFVLAVVHLFYSLIIVLLAILKVKRWRKWEEEAQESSRRDVTNVTRAATLGRKSFVMRHTARAWNRNSLTVWVVCFFRQFGRGVTRSDYLSLRRGFIAAHKISPTFDFHHYLLKSLDDEFPDVVGISPYHWVLVVLLLALAGTGIHAFFIAAFVPLVLLLAIGTKLQQIITALAWDEALGLRDDLFWFNRPRLVLSLIRFIMFQNAYEMTSFLCLIWAFGIHSCILGQKGFTIGYLAIGLVLQIFCSYSTLPLYAIVTQMGSSYKRAIFSDNVRDQLHVWRRKAGERAKRGIRREEEFPDEDGSVGKRSNSQRNSFFESLEDDPKNRDHDDSSTYRKNIPEEMTRIPNSSSEGGAKVCRCKSEPISHPLSREHREALSLVSAAPRREEVFPVDIRIDTKSSN